MANQNTNGTPYLCRVPATVRGKLRDIQAPEIPNVIPFLTPTTIGGEAQTFAVRCQERFDSIEHVFFMERAYVRRALLRSELIVMCRVSGAKPLLLLHNVCKDPLATTFQERTKYVTATDLATDTTQCTVPFEQQPVYRVTVKSTDLHLCKALGVVIRQNQDYTQVDVEEGDLANIHAPYLAVQETALLQSDVNRICAVKFSLETTVPRIIDAGILLKAAGFKVHFANAALFVVDADVNDHTLARLQDLVKEFKVHEVCTMSSLRDAATKTWATKTPQKLMILKCAQAQSLAITAVKAIATFLHAEVLRTDFLSCVLRVTPDTVPMVINSGQYELVDMPPKEQAV